MDILTDSDDVGGLVDGKDNRNKITETGYVEWIKYPWNTKLKQMFDVPSLLLPSMVSSAS